MRRLLSTKLIALHVLGLVATTAAVLLGLWQLDAWQAGRALASRDLADARPVPLGTVLGPDATFRSDDVGRPVTLSGQWLPESTLLVDGRQQAGRDGRWVVTPVTVCQGGPGCADDPAILVVRGWLGDADVVPPAPTGAVSVTGWLQPGEGAGIPDPDPDDNVLPELRIASAIQHVDQDLYGGFVVAEVPTDPTSALEPVSPSSLPEPGSFTSLRNLLYAVEWWVFAGFAAFLWWRWVRDEVEAEDAARAADLAEPVRDRDAEDVGIASRP